MNANVVRTYYPDGRLKSLSKEAIKPFISELTSLSQFLNGDSKHGFVNDDFVFEKVELSHDDFYGLRLLFHASNEVGDVVGLLVHSLGVNPKTGKPECKYDSLHRSKYGTAWKQVGIKGDGAFLYPLVVGLLGKIPAEILSVCHTLIWDVADGASRSLDIVRFGDEYGKSGKYLIELANKSSLEVIEEDNEIRSGYVSFE